MPMSVFLSMRKRWCINGGKMFALIPLEKNGIIAILKHSSESIEELKESHHGISEPAYLSKIIGYKLIPTPWFATTAKID